MQSRFRLGAGGVPVCVVCVPGRNRNRKLCCQTVRRIRRSWPAGGGASCLQAPAEMSENGMCASSAATQVAGFPTCWACRGRAGGLACTVAAHPDGPMCRRELEREKKQMEGIEAEKDRMKSKKRGTTTLPCSLGENRLQRSRFRLGRTIICTHEQTAKPTIHALADPSCRHVFVCRAHPPTHRLSCLECHFCPPRFAHLDMAWHGMQSLLLQSCLTRSVPSAT